MTTPDWFGVDHTARRVNLTITAGLTPVANNWNFNGYINGGMAINVPEGYTVNIEFTNRDPNMAHSLGISAETSNFSVPPQPTPVFPGAISQNPGSMVDGTMPGETETITFVAERAGNYSMVCYIPGHTAIGMWAWFTVTTGQEAGVQVAS
jgi:FtsP/CotA-like multicopper oxidase with cupredoxin domain